MSEVIAFLTELPPGLVYLILGVGAALENIVPPIPADTFVVLGGLISSRGSASPLGVFLATWLANTGSALAVYGVGRRYGAEFFRGRIGRRLIQPNQLRRLHDFYARWGPWAIFLTRFLPGFRAIVPVFAGVTHQPIVPVAIPLIAASAIWYGLLTWLGALTGRNLDSILGYFEDLNRTLLIVAGALALVLLYLWYRSREASHEADDVSPTSNPTRVDGDADGDSASTIDRMA